MVIQTISQRYTVIRRLSGSMPSYICREECGTDGLFLLVEVTDGQLSKKFVPYFMELGTGESKGGFVDCFTDGGSFWLVFNYHEYPTLREKMAGYFPIDERLEAGRSLMTQLLMQDMPYYLQYVALKPDNVVVSDVPEVYFNLRLCEPELLNRCELLDVQRELAKCFEVLFELELKDGVVPELAAFIKGLRETEYSGYFGIYRDYRKVYELISAKNTEGRLKPERWPFKLWRYFKAFLRVFLKILAVAVLLALAGLLIYLIVRPASAPTERPLFGKIGTLTIEDADKALRGIHSLRGRL